MAELRAERSCYSDHDRQDTGPWAWGQTLQAALWAKPPLPTCPPLVTAEHLPGDLPSFQLLGTNQESLNGKTGAENEGSQRGSRLPVLRVWAARGARLSSGTRRVWGSASCAHSRARGPRFLPGTRTDRQQGHVRAPAPRHGQALGVRSHPSERAFQAPR